MSAIFSNINSLEIEEFAFILKKCFQQPLPSERAHLEMLPETRVPSSNNNIAEASKSSVLVLFYPKNSNIFTVFIERQVYDGVHSGQISFPGGKFEKPDKSLIKTVLREANEEIGIEKNMISLTGKLSQVYISPSNNIVTPYLGICKDTPLFTPDKREVKKIIEVPVSDIINEQNISKANVEAADGKLYEVPCFIFKNNIIWGATAMILNEFIVLWKSMN